MVESIHVSGYWRELDNFSEKSIEFENWKKGIVNTERNGVSRMGNVVYPSFLYALSSFHQIGKVKESIPPRKGK